MSQVIWQQLLLPDLQSQPVALTDANYQSSVLRVRKVAKSSEEFAIPDPKAYRSMSRASVFLSHICQQAKDILQPYLQESAFRVGIYCAVENGPIDATSTKKIIQQNNPALFADYYRKFRNPKMYLKQLPNLVSAQMAISMQIHGPMNVYTHSTAGSLHALEQAEWDLQTQQVRAALVCTAHAFDDFLVIQRERNYDSRCLSEAAGALLLVANGQFTDWTKVVKKDEENFFGIADQIVNLLIR